MTVGTIELVVLGFPGSRFTGEVRPRIEELVDRGIVNVVDGVLVQKADDGSVVITEFEDLLDDAQTAALAEAFPHELDLISGADLEQLTVDLAPGDSALALAFEHVWIKPLNAAVAASGGVVLADVQIPGANVERALAATADTDASASPTGE